MSKMYGISPKLPLKVSNIDGPYGLTKSIGEAIKQNFKNLILTAPGERVMLPNFGVGLREYFFEPINSQTFQNIAGNIQEQKNMYMPFLVIEDIFFQTSDDNDSLSFNEVGIEITYTLPGVNTEDTLKITANQAYL
jgi:phage baseplate assembly protein W